jgi:hypothetical protein
MKPENFEQIKQLIDQRNEIEFTLSQILGAQPKCVSIQFNCGPKKEVHTALIASEFEDKYEALALNYRINVVAELRADIANIDAKLLEL